MTQQATRPARGLSRTAYQTWMEAQAIPIHGGYGVEGARNVERKPWKLTGTPGAFSYREGGTLIEYEDEDPQIKVDFEATLHREGIASKMPAFSYTSEVR